MKKEPTNGELLQFMQATNQEMLEAVNTALTRVEVRVRSIEDRMATKQDLEGFATKHDLRSMEHNIRDHFDTKLADTNSLIRGHELRVVRLESFHS